MDPNKLGLTDEEYELYIKEYNEWVQKFEPDPDQWWKDLEAELGEEL